MSSQLSSILTQTIGTFSISAILSAALTLLICLVVVRVLLKLTKKLLSGSKLDQRVQKYILSGIRLLLYIVTALIVADCLHINMTSLVALLSVGSLGVTLALPSETLWKFPGPPARWMRSPSTTPNWSRPTVSWSCCPTRSWPAPA